MGTRARLGIVTVLAAALIGLGSPAPAEADLASGDDHDADVETPSVSFTQVAKVPTVTIEPVGPAPADDLPDGTQTSTEIDEDTQVVDAGPVSIDLRDNVDELADGGDPARVDVVVAEAGVAAETGIDGVLLDVQPSQLLTAPVEIAIDYSDYADVYGGDWASRLTLAALPGCDLDTADGCGQVDAMASVNDTDAQVLTATVRPDALGVLALTAATSGSTGDWAVTPASPSTGDVSARTGDFTWSYPFRVPPAGSAPTPELALSYSSGSVDGRVSTTNNQSSWIGEGWGLSEAFIDRSYVPCATDATGAANNVAHRTGDLCWGTDSATLHLDGRAVELVLDDASGSWRSPQDSGLRIDRLTGASHTGNDGEYWQLTDTDGTRYYFGRDRRPSDNLALKSAWVVPVYGNHPGEPCYDASFAQSWCKQVWRWNLDHVVDPAGNTMTYVYEKENTNYGQNNNTAIATYTRAGYLTRIDYAQREGSATPDAPARVTFAVAERCTPSGAITCAPSQLTAANASRWPDVPFDLICTSKTSCPNVTSPVFFTRKRLVTVTTMVLNGSAYRNVDQWTLTQKFPDPGDGTSKQMWLKTIQHTGLAGSSPVTMPPVTFNGVQLANRVDRIGDIGPPMIRFRIASIITETGAVISVNYSSPDCTSTSLPASPQTNDRLCMPVYWDPEGSTPMTLEYFHKYVVTSTVENAGSASDSIVTSYTYRGDPAWHFTANRSTPTAYRTWSDFRGYGSVDVRIGSASVTRLRTVYEFFRGMHGDKASPAGGTRTVTVDGINDYAEYTGMLRSETVYNGSAIDAVTQNSPWRSSPVATGADGRTVRHAAVATVDHTVAAPALAGDERTTRTVTSFDAEGMPVSVEDLGDISVTGDERCTRTEYVRNAAAHILDTVRRVETVGVTCGAAPSRPADVISDVRTHYDGQAFGAAPVVGLATTQERIASYSGSTPSYQTVTTSTYDAAGRLLTETDALGRTTRTGYSPATGGLLSTRTVTGPDPDGAGPLTSHVTTTRLDIAWGAELSVTDANGNVTAGTYDAVGRLLNVWLPGRTKGTDSANVKYSYKVSTTGINTVVRRTLIHNGSYLVAVTVYDGLMRQRQTQETTADRDSTGKIVTDTVYDSRGLVAYENGPWYASGSPSSGGVTVPRSVVPSTTVYAYDGVGRPTATITQVSGREVWRTTTGYGGDRLTTVPPEGGVPTTEIYDAGGQVVELRQFHGSTASGAYDAIGYGYDDAGNRTLVTDAAGNEWTWDYDLRGRLTSQSTPDSGTTGFTYDDADQRLTSTDARGVTLSTTYDGLGRRTELREDSPSGPLRSSWAWDTLAEGQLTSSTRYDDGHAYVSAVTGYDAGYRPLGESVTIPAVEGALAGTYRFGYTYTIDGQLKQTQLPAAGGLLAENVNMFYDNRGLPEWMNGGPAGNVYVSGTERSVYGELLMMDVGAGHVNQLNFSYQTGTRRPDQLFFLREGQPTYDLDISYHFDDAGNLFKIYDRAVGEAQCFSHAMGRLVQAWTPATRNCNTTRSSGALAGPAPYWHTYSFDAAGNRTRLVDHTPTGDLTTTYTRPAAGADHAHALLSTSTTGGAATSYTYDDAGNTLTRTSGTTTQNLTWDPEGRLDTLTDGVTSHEYVYTADGERLIRRQGDVTTLFLPNGQELTLTGTTVTALLTYSFVGIPVASRTGRLSTTLTTQISDHVGTPIISINNNTNALIRRYQDPFGNARGVVPPWVSDHGFLDEPTDTTGLTLLGDRYYDPTIGQLISPAPSVDGGGLRPPDVYDGVEPVPGLGSLSGQPITGSASCPPTPGQCGID